MNKKHLLLFGLCALMAVGQPVVAHAGEVTDFENWTPDGNGGYKNSSGQSGSDGSSDVHVQDEGSGKSESSSSSSESGTIINTDTEKQTSVTIDTTVTEENTNTMESVTNGQMVPVGEEQSNRNEHTNSGSNNNSDNGDGSYSEENEGGAPQIPSQGDKPDNPFQGNTNNSNASNGEYENGSPGSPLNPGTPDQNKEGHDYGTHWGLASAESMEEVIVDENGNWILKYRFSDGTVSEMSFESVEEFTFVLTGVKDEYGNKTRKEYKFKRSDALEEWIFKYFSWRAVNLTYKTSSYYGIGKIVAKTTKSSAVFTLDEAGKYRILATPYHDVRHYHIYHWSDEDGDHSEEVTDYWEYDRKKSPDTYSVVVPIITDDGKPIKVCINGGCDCETDLNAVCDEANEPQYDIENRVELEK